MSRTRIIGIGLMVCALWLTGQPTESMAALADSELQVSLKITTLQVTNLFTYISDSSDFGQADGDKTGTGQWDARVPVSTRAGNVITFGAGVPKTVWAHATSQLPSGMAWAMSTGNSMAFALHNFSGSGGGAPPAQPFEVELEINWSYLLDTVAGANETAEADYSFQIWNERTGTAIFGPEGHSISGTDHAPPPLPASPAHVSVTLPANSVTKISIDGWVTAKVATIPEPATLGLLLLGSLVFLSRRK